MERIIIMMSLVLFCSVSWGRLPLEKKDVAKIISEFQYPNNYKEIRSEGYGSIWDDCWVYEKTFETDYPGASESLTVHARLYIPNRHDLDDKKVASVIMLPPIGGMNFLDKQMAKTFCAYEIAAMVLTNDFANIDSQANGTLEPVTDHQETFYRTVAGVKSAMAYIEDDENLDFSKIGMFGVSLGGVLGSFTMGTQKEISAGYFVVAGGDVPNILAHSEQKEVSRIREKRMAQENIQTREEFEDYLRQYIHFDPMDMAVTMVPEALRLVIAKKDKTVPTDNQMALFEAFGRPDANFVNKDHVDTVIASLLFATERRDVARFFADRFDSPNPRPSAFDFVEQFSLTAYIQ